MDKIHVIDNFLDNDELHKCNSIIKLNGWTWGHTSNNDIKNTPFWLMILSDNDYFTIYIKNIIEKTFSKKFKVDRVYANGQTYGQDSVYHTDCSDPNCYTFCLYLTDIKEEYIETAGGHLFFKFPELNYKIGYEPKFNRGILFPSNYLHKACAFSRYIMDLRICIAWKLEEII